jgi:xylan 1,4-beta-xylosidase
MNTAEFHCDLSTPATPLPHFWEHTVGSCHAPLALRADWQDHLRQCHAELGFRHVRFHGLLCDDVSTLVRHKGRLVYSFLNADRIIDFLLSIGVRPFVELSFMPSAIASGTKTLFHYRGNVTPPRDYDEWEELIRRLAAHWVERYGADEVRQWYFEVWNEPNLKDFWAGGQQDYFRLYVHTARALKRVDDGLRVGGPATAQEAWIDEFLDFCTIEGLPVDFVSTHHYPNDVLWYEDQDTETQLAASRRSQLREGIRASRSQARDWPLFYTEWNCSSNPRYPPQDEPYAAAFAIKSVLEAAGLLDCYSWWTFTDLFEENHFPSLPFHGGFGLLTVHGVPKPTYRAFQLLHHLGKELLPVEGAHPTADVWVVRKSGEITILLTNHALPRHPVETVNVRVRLSGAPKVQAAHVQRIDEDHANPKRTWQEMGEPEYLKTAEVERLREASRLVLQPQSFEQRDDCVEGEVVLPPHGVAAVTLTFGERRA